MKNHPVGLSAIKELMLTYASVVYSRMCLADLHGAIS